MDFATIIGAVGGFILIILSILVSGASLRLYISLSSFILVIVGSFAALMVANPFSVVRKVPVYLKLIFTNVKYDYEGLINTIVSFSEKARREGILALEDDIDDLEDEFLKKGIQMAVDGSDPEMIKTMLDIEIEKMEERHNIGINLFSLWGEIAPAFGMIGTLMGLIQMLANLEDKSNIARGMSTALITTMYGSIFANLFLIPMMTKLSERNRKEVMVKEIMVEGILSIQGGENPTMLKLKLTSFLSPKERLEVGTEGV